MIAFLLSLLAILSGVPQTQTHTQSQSKVQGGAPQPPQVQDEALQPIQVDVTRADGQVLDAEVFVGQRLHLQLDLWMDVEFQQQQLVSFFRQPLDLEKSSPKVNYSDFPKARH